MVLNNGLRPYRYWLSSRGAEVVLQFSMGMSLENKSCISVTGNPKHADARLLLGALMKNRGPSLAV